MTTCTALEPDLLEGFREAVGRENVIESPLEVFGYSYDASFLPLDTRTVPQVVVRPRTTAEISRVMVLAHRSRIPVTPRGAASGRTGGSVPLQGGIVLALDRMTSILELDTANMMVSAEPGVRTIDLHDHCARQGLFFPPDPGSWKVSTLGGNIAENAGGMRAVKYGVTRDYVMGLEVVLADGSVLETGGKAVKNVTGYDLTGLFVGSEGTLGIVSRALFRLRPLPKARGVLRVVFRTMDEACAAVQAMLLEGVTPSAAEIMDAACLEAVALARKTSLEAGAGACLILEIDGDGPEALDAQSRRIEAITGQAGRIGFRAAATREETEALWAERRGLSSAVAAMAPNRLGEDISVPRSAFPEVVRRINAISRATGLRIPVFGHAGDGNLHPSVLCDLADPDQAARAHEAVDGIFKAALELGGTLSGEHGIGVSKRPYFAGAVGPVSLEAHRAVKGALDPLWILNPGKIW
ncbi:FAD-binding oxidoreductase [Geothrix fermentans]|jgi:glycolate oxidase|uniref:FAD-binding oxidoreductase n=1 Tax=Geothrix fermentans TaxID=44676 RepID=UPI00040DAE7F|nr:FAD-linked oxidase C-terminal domain-containing protein [Geothrix fermentans]